MEPNLTVASRFFSVVVAFLVIQGLGREISNTNRTPGGIMAVPEYFLNICLIPFVAMPKLPCKTWKHSVCINGMCLDVKVSLNHGKANAFVE